MAEFKTSLSVQMMEPQWRWIKWQNVKRRKHTFDVNNILHLLDLTLYPAGTAMAKSLEFLIWLYASYAFTIAVANCYSYLHWKKCTICAVCIYRECMQILKWSLILQLCKNLVQMCFRRNDSLAITLLSHHRRCSLWNSFNNKLWNAEPIKTFKAPLKAQNIDKHWFNDTWHWMLILSIYLLFFFLSFPQF